MYEVVVKDKQGRIRNAFFPTQQQARRYYQYYHIEGFEGDIYQREEA
jgi:hypothetical protein